MTQIEMNSVICKSCGLPNSLNTDGICSQCVPREVMETDADEIPWRYIAGIVIVGLMIALFGYFLPASVAKEKVRLSNSRIEAGQPCK